MFKIPSPTFSSPSQREGEDLGRMEGEEKGGGGSISLPNLLESTDK